jgi:YVTN family beta-propeller protein
VVFSNIPIGDDPASIAADPANDVVWASSVSGSGQLYEIPESSGAATMFPTSTPAYALATDSDTDTLWTANKAGNSVSRFSESDPTSGTTTAVGRQPLGVAVDEVTGTTWVANSGSGTVSELSRPGQMAQTFKVRAFPSAVATDPVSGTVWVTDSGADRLSLISEGTETVARTLTTGSYPDAVAVDGLTDTVWVANARAGTVTEYAYSYPYYTSRTKFPVTTGRKASFKVTAGGFPLPAMTLSGHLPKGLHAEIALGVVTVHGTADRSDRHGQYKLTVSACNGVSRAGGQVRFRAHVVITVK